MVGWAKARRQAPPLPHGSYATAPIIFRKNTLIKLPQCLRYATIVRISTTNWHLCHLEMVLSQYHSRMAEIIEKSSDAIFLLDVLKQSYSTGIALVIFVCLNFRKSSTTAFS